MGIEPSWSLSGFKSWQIQGRSQKNILTKGGLEILRQGNTVTRIRTRVFFKPADCFQYKQDIDEEFVRDRHREVYLAFYEVGTVLRVRQMRWEQFI